MSNSDNAESIFGHLLTLTIADTFTPLEWENYVPYRPRRERTYESTSSALRTMT